MNSQEVRQYLQRILRKFTINQEQIIVISGKWGLTSHLLRSNRGNKKLLNAAKHHVLALKLSATATDDDDDDTWPNAVWKMDANAIAKQLEEASNIKSLEKE